MQRIPNGQKAECTAAVLIASASLHGQKAGEVLWPSFAFWGPSNKEWLVIDVILVGPNYHSNMPIRKRKYSKNGCLVNVQYKEKNYTPDHSMSCPYDSVYIQILNCESAWVRHALRALKMSKQFTYWIFMYCKISQPRSYFTLGLCSLKMNIYIYTMHGLESLTFASGSKKKLTISDYKSKYGLHSSIQQNPKFTKMNCWMLQRDGISWHCIILVKLFLCSLIMSSKFQLNVN